MVRHRFVVARGRNRQAGPVAPAVKHRQRQRQRAERELARGAVIEFAQALGREAEIAGQAQRRVERALGHADLRVGRAQQRHAGGQVRPLRQQAGRQADRNGRRRRQVRFAQRGDQRRRWRHPGQRRQAVLERIALALELVHVRFGVGPFQPRARQIEFVRQAAVETRLDQVLRFAPGAQRAAHNHQLGVQAAQLPIGRRHLA